MSSAGTSREKAQQGLRLLKEAVLELLEQHREDLTNAEVAEHLDIHADYHGAAKDYLSWSVLGLLLNEGHTRHQGRRYYLASPARPKAEDR